MLVCAEKHKAGEKVSIVTNWEVERVGSRTEVILDGRAQYTQAILNVSINTAVSGYMVDLFCYVMGQYLPVRPMCSNECAASRQGFHGSWKCKAWFRIRFNVLTLVV